MKFKLARQEISPDLDALYIKTIKKQNLYLPQPNKAFLKKLVEISQIIQSSGLPEHLVLKKLKGNIGHGIFLHPEASSIPAGEAIGPYSGEVFISSQDDENDSDSLFGLLSNISLTREEQLFWDPKKRFQPNRLFSIDIDASKKGNFTRYINHSEKPNVEAKHLCIPFNSSGQNQPSFEIIYLAKKTILPGEQLLVSYDKGSSKSYWGPMKLKPFPMTPTTFKLTPSLELI